MSSGHSRRTVVVGGGIAGLLSAALLSRRGRDVIVVDAGDRLGGLLSSVPGPADLWFDHGTHIPQATGRSALDEVLFGSLDDGWRELATLRAGNVFQGDLNQSNQFPDLRLLPAATYHRCAVELVDAAFSSDSSAALDLASDLRRRFGSTVCEKVFRPMLKRFTGHQLEALAPASNALFCDRVVAFEAAAARRLKSIPELDRPLGFHSYREGQSSRRAWYPRSGGCGRWISTLQERELSGVDIRLGSGVAALSVDRRTVQSLQLASGEEVETDTVVWTLPMAAFLRAAGVTFPKDTVPPQFAQTQLHHLVLDRPLAIDLHYATFFDPSFESFRVTLYPSLHGRDDLPPSCTVEVISPRADQSEEQARESVVEDLLRARILSSGTTVTWSRMDTIEAGFPIPTSEFRRSTEVLAEIGVELGANVHFLGRSTGRSFFMADVLTGVFDALSHPS